MTFNIHTYLQQLGAADSSKPLILVDERPQLSKSQIRRLFADAADKDPMQVLKSLKSYLISHLEEIDGRDLPALTAISNYFKELQISDENTTWVANLCHSFETLNSTPGVEVQPAPASTIPNHIQTGYRIRIAEQTKLISAGIAEEAMQKGTVIEGGETEASLVKLLAKAEKKEHKRRKTKISVINKDCLVIAGEFKDQTNVTLLNMSNANGPGGGWLIGDCAQEEELFRRTNYYRALTPEYNPFLQEQLTDGRYRVPFYGAIFTPNVTVLRDSENQVFPTEQRFQINMIASAALDLRPYHSNAELQMCGGDSLDNRLIERFTKQKIRAQLSVALLHDTKILILGAFGCGAFRNPPSLIAQCYKDVLEESLFKHAFKEVIFPIIDFRGTDNFAVFSNKFD